MDGFLGQVKFNLCGSRHGRWMGFWVKLSSICVVLDVEGGGVYGSGRVHNVDE